ncbi:MAG TPA: recombinase family protein [Candidatus Paceibacterota bacterium]|nr:recombinase family protein [Candidatus Paceibacterota bacterium]
MTMNQENESVRAVGYARVSSKDQEDTGYSLPAQEKLLRDHADRNGYELVKVFAIQESAAGKVQRKIFHEMMAYVSKAKINTVFVETTDRLTRNFADVPVIDEWILANDQHKIHLVKESCTLHKEAKSHEWFMWRVKVATAEYYIRLLSENVKKGQKEKLAQGWLPSKPPLGYKTVGEKGHKIHVIDPDKAPLVKKMFELYATNIRSTKKLGDEMYALGMRSRGGSKVSHSRVHQLLGDPFYYGMNRWNGKVAKGEHEPLITKELFMRCQEIMHSNGTPRYFKHNSLFKNVFRCNECKGRITWEIQKGHWYGHCNHYKNCTQRDWVKQENIDEQVIERITGLQPRNEQAIENMLGWVQEALKEGHADEITFREKATGELNRRYEMVTQRLDKLYDDKIDGKISQDFYQKKFAQYKLEQEEIMDSLNKHQNANLKYYEMGVTVLEVAQQAWKIYQNRTAPEMIDDKRLLLSLIFSNATIDGKNIDVSYHKAFKIIFDRVHEALGEKLPENKTFEPPKKPVNKGKTPAFADVNPIWLPR